MESDEGVETTSTRDKKIVAQTDTDLAYLHNNLKTLCITGSQNMESSSHYSDASSLSQFDADVDRWIHGSTANVIPVFRTRNTGIQDSRSPLVQRHHITNHTTASGIWYIFAMMLPFFSMNNTPWRCTPSSVLHTAQLLVTQIRGFCRSFAEEMHRVLESQFSADLFATAMDIVLVVYALGFLALSMYQVTLTR